jgi:trehalose-phosphatase
MNTPAMQNAQERVVAAASAGSRVLLMFDYDGTLSPTVDEPCLATVPTHTQQALGQLATMPACRLGIISGRSLDDLRKRIGIPGLFLAGSGGVEMEIDGCSSSSVDVEAARLKIDRLWEAINPFVTTRNGVSLERKPLGLTIHHRNAARPDVAAVRDLAARLQREWNDGLRIVTCELGVEIQPFRCGDKGGAVRTFYAASGARKGCVLYAGNDANDTEAMEAVTLLRGITIGVGVAAPPADHVFTDPDQLGMFLVALVRRLSDAAPN